MKILQTIEEFRQRVQQFWYDLQQRERHIIAGGTALILFAALWLLGDSLLSERSRLQEEKQRLVDNLGWLQEQSALLADMQHSCADSRILDEGPERLFEMLAQRNQSSLEDLQRSRDGVLHLTFSSGNGNRLLTLAHQSVCQGYMLESISITSPASDEGSEGSRVLGQLELSRDARS